jgi:hypothetical protein
MARRTQFKLTMPVVPEHSIQAVMARTLTLEIAPAGKLSRFGVVWFSVDHANYAGEVPGVRLGRGIISGIPDTFFFYRSGTYLIELKAADGQLTETQMATLAAVSLAGIKCAVCDSVDHVLRTLDDWTIPRKRVVMFQMPQEAAIA